MSSPVGPGHTTYRSCYYRVAWWDIPQAELEENVGDRPGLLHRLPVPPLAGLVVPPRYGIRPRGRQPPSVPPSIPGSKTASTPVLHQKGRLGKVSKTTQGGCCLSRVHHRRCSRSRRLRERRFIASTGHRRCHKRIDPSEATMR